MKPPHPGIRDISDLVREWEPFRLQQIVVGSRHEPCVHRIDRDQFVAFHRMSAIVLSCPTLTDGRALWCEGMAYQWAAADAYWEWHSLQAVSRWRCLLLLPEW